MNGVLYGKAERQNSFSCEGGSVLHFPGCIFGGSEFGLTGQARSHAVPTLLSDPCKRPGPSRSRRRRSSLPGTFHAHSLFNTQLPLECSAAAESAGSPVTSLGRQGHLTICTVPQGHRGPLLLLPAAYWHTAVADASASHFTHDVLQQERGMVSFPINI